MRRKIASGVAAAAMIAGGVFCLGDGELANRFFLYSGAPFYVAADKAEKGAGSGGMGGGGAEALSDKAEHGAAENTALYGDNAAPAVQPPGSDGGAIAVGGGVYQIDYPIDRQIDRQIDHGGGSSGDAAALLPYSVDQLRDFEFLRKNFYTVNPDTGLLPSDVDIDSVLSADFKLSPDNAGAPKVLIFHTHMYESFAGSDINDINQGVYGAGERLAEDLRSRGIPVIHVSERFDMVDGSVSVYGAYERMEPVIRRILAENPSIEVCIDLHRDGVTTTEPAVAAVDGRRAARIMLFNGLSRIRSGDGITKIAGLDNPNLKENLEFSLRLLLASEWRFPGFAKRIYLKPYRYSLHMLPKSILVEIGNQNNTLDEAVYAMDLLSDIIYGVVGG